jgi:hypothetical protein
MITVKRAHHIEIYLCEHCASVHIGLFRDGELFAEAIPNEPALVLDDLTKAVAKSAQRQGTGGLKH